MKENEIYCSHCGTIIDNDDYVEWNDEIYCSYCIEHNTTVCDCCSCLIHNDDTYRLDGEDYCHECYDEECDKCFNIHDYSYKPEPVFYGDSRRYFGVELEIDGAGKDDDYAEEFLEIANIQKPHIYIKSDGSLDDGMELVSHPMTLEYHKTIMNWEDIFKRAVRLGYRSHQTSTCGLHVYVNRISGNAEQKHS